MLGEHVVQESRVKKRSSKWCTNRGTVAKASKRRDNFFVLINTQHVSNWLVHCHHHYSKTYVPYTENHWSINLWALQTKQLSKLAVQIVVFQSSAKPPSFSKATLTNPHKQTNTYWHDMTQHDWTWHNMTWHTLSHATLSYSMLHHNPIQYNTIRYNTIQDNTICVLYIKYHKIR